MDVPTQQNRLSLTSIQAHKAGNTWQTEAMRSHSTARLLYFTKGQGRITVAGLTSGYGPNNLIYIPPNTQYGFEVGPMVFGHMLSIPSAVQPDWPDMPVHLRLRDVLIQNEFAGQFDALERELKSTRDGHNRAALYLLGLLSVSFERQLNENPPVESNARARTSQARLVAAYTDLVERSYKTGKGVADFAAELGVTPTHLTRCCNQTCGKSALAILHDRILFDARDRLQNTKTPVKQIASDLGFSSAAYFTRSFQSETGVTPSAFRKQYAN